MSHQTLVWHTTNRKSEKKNSKVESTVNLDRVLKIPLQYVCVNFGKILISKTKEVTIHQDISFVCLISAGSNLLSTSYQINFQDITHFRYCRKNFLFNISLKEEIFKKIFPNQSSTDPLFSNIIWFCLDFDSLNEYDYYTTKFLQTKPDGVIFMEMPDDTYQSFSHQFCQLKPDSKLKNNLTEKVPEVSLKAVPETPVEAVPEPISEPPRKKRKEDFLCDEKFLSKKGQMQSDIRCIYSPSPAHSITISNSDLHCLRPKQYINDNIINFYITYLYHEKLNVFQRNRTHFFNCFFNTKLIGSEYMQKSDTVKSRHERVAKWTKNVDIFEKDFLIIPVIEKQHWFLVIVCFPWMVGLIDYKKLMSNGENAHSQIPVNDSEWARVTRMAKLEALTSGKDPSCISKPMPCILVFDSLHMENRSAKVNIIRDYLKSEWDSKRAAKDGPLIFDRTTARGYCPKVPLQNNNSDCGIYLLHYIELFYQNPIQEFTYEFFREKLVGWFQRDAISKKRKYIEEFIKTLPAR